MGCKSRKSTFTEKVTANLNGASDQALPRIEAARDALLAELAPHAAGAGRKARKQLTAATALATASVEVARHALAPAQPAPKPRRGKKLALLLALAGIGALVFKTLRPNAEPSSYESPVTKPAAPTAPVPTATAPVDPAPVDPAPADPAPADPVPTAPVEPPVVPVPDELAVPEEFDQPVAEPNEEATEEPAGDGDEEPEQAPEVPAESLTSFFDQVLIETEEAKKRKR